MDVKNGINVVAGPLVFRTLGVLGQVVPHDLRQITMTCTPSPICLTQGRLKALIIGLADLLAGFPYQFAMQNPTPQPIPRAV